MRQTMGSMSGQMCPRTQNSEIIYLTLKVQIHAVVITFGTSHAVVITLGTITYCSYHLRNNHML